MITEKDVERYLGDTVAVRTIDGDVFYGRYEYWQIDVDDEIPNAMVFDALYMDLDGGEVEIPAVEIESVEGFPWP